MDACRIVEWIVRVYPFIELIHDFWELLNKDLVVKYWFQQFAEELNDAFYVICDACPWVFWG